jgi:hypothetical protein
MDIENQVIDCLKRHGFTKNINMDWRIYEQAKRQVLLDINIENSQEYELIISTITEYLNV